MSFKCAVISFSVALDDTIFCDYAITQLNYLASEKRGRFSDVLHAINDNKCIDISCLSRL